MDFSGLLERKLESVSGMRGSGCSSSKDVPEALAGSTWSSEKRSLVSVISEGERSGKLESANIMDIVGLAGMSRAESISKVTKLS